MYLGINLITIAYFPTKTNKQKPKHNNNQKFTTGLNELQQLEGPPAKNTSDIHHRCEDALNLNYTLLNTTVYTDRQIDRHLCQQDNNPTEISNNLLGQQLLFKRT